MDKREDTGNYYPGGTVVTGVPQRPGGGGSSVEVVAPSADGAGKAADAAAVYEALEAKQDALSDGQIAAIARVIEGVFATEADLLAFYYPDGNVTRLDQLTTSGIEYAVGEDGGAYVVKGEGLSGDVVLPWKVTIEGKEYNVTGIGDGAFNGDRHYNNLTRFYAPITVKSIGDSAFSVCSSLTSVDFPSATSIGNSAFFVCSSLSSVDFPSATSIGGSAFENCESLTSVDFPSAASIGIYAFYTCRSLAFVNIPSSTSIEVGAFTDCESLKMVDFGSSPKPIIPTLAPEAPFANVPITCRFIIPLGMYDDWIAEPGWSDLYAAGFEFEGYVSVERVKSTILDFKEDILRACVAKYPFGFRAPVIEDGVKLFYARPFTSLSYPAGDEDGEKVGVRMEEIDGLGDVVRDCTLVIDTRGKSFAPTVTWLTNFHPRTDAETDFACEVGVRNVYWITEHATDEFTVAGWQETTGGNAQ